MTLRSTNVSQNHQLKYFNPLDSKCNYSANIEQYKVGTLAVDRWAVTFGIQQGGDWAAAALPSPLLAVQNVTAYPSTASVPITVLLYKGPLLCGFNVAIKGLKFRCKTI